MSGFRYFSMLAVVAAVSLLAGCAGTEDRAPSSQSEEKILQESLTQTNRAKQGAADEQKLKEEAQVHARRFETELTGLAVKQTARGLVVTLLDSRFDATGMLTQEGFDQVRRLANVLQQYPLRSVLVEGFSDNHRTAQENLEFTEQRADAVVAALIKHGVTQDRIRMRGYGSSFPLADNTSNAGRQLNRRVEILISEDDGRITYR